MNIVHFAKLQNESGNGGLDRDAYHREIEKRAAASRLENETAAQSYTRVATETVEGRELLKAYRNAAAPKQAPQDFVRNPKPEPIGAANRELERLADELAADGKLSSAQARARVLERNKELLHAVMAEERAATREVHNQRGPIWAAQRGQR